MNFPDLRKLEDEICRKRVDWYDALDLMDAVMSSLGNECEIPEKVEEAYAKLVAELKKMGEYTPAPDEMDEARDFLIAQEEA